MKCSIHILVLVVTMLCFFGCTSKKTGDPMFEVLAQEQTGLNFSNTLQPTAQFNIFQYMYFYNGAGIAAGDFNKDGLVDLFFTANQSQNKLFLNKGDLRFEDVTAAAKIPDDGAWSTGASVVDINNDGLLDIYVCRVGKHQILKGQNQLLICKGIDKNGVPFFEDEAKAYGLDFSGYSTQAAFFDYDLDGDLDMYLLNHSVHENGTFRPRADFLGTNNELSGDRIYRNDGGIFKNVTAETGINSTAIGYGLGIAVADVNMDGYPDIYIGNDFHENDYMYINQQNGTFKEELTKRTMHSSQFTMGVDVADANNDGFPEIMSLDMMPYDPYILKRSEGEDSYDIFNMKLGYGYNNQFARNSLQMNRRNGQFSEVGFYSNVFATDWSWAALWMDFDNDGLKDMFISNGIPKRMNDIDYINFVSNEEIQRKIKDNSLAKNDMALIEKFPKIKIPNKFYRNNGDMVFEDLDSRIQKNQPTYSNGSVYADLDNDGDLDVVVNNIDEPVFVYKNKSNDKQQRKSLSVELIGDSLNRNAIGTRLVLFANNEIRTYEKFPVRGFQSSMEIPMHIGMVNTKIDSAFLVWPDNSYTSVNIKAADTKLSFTYQKNLPRFDYATIINFHKNTADPVIDITTTTQLLHKHTENDFVEFNREPLIPKMISREGPALETGDMNGDGLTDVFIGSAKGYKSTIWLQQPGGKFSEMKQPMLEADSIYEDVDASMIDLNKDGFTDLVVASGGNEYYGTDIHLLSRVYLNDGKGNLIRKENAIPGIYLTASGVEPIDFNGDGYPDLFLGGRAVPWEYGNIPRSYLLQNDGTGSFKDVTNTLAPELANIGLVTDARWVDMNKDKLPDLLISTEWGSLVAFMNEKGKLRKKILAKEQGWWNFMLPVDIDGDGDLDIIAGNLGLNSRLKASSDQPIRLYYNDFDGNGKKEQVMTYYLNGKEIPFATKDELQKQIPPVKKRFLYAEDFAKANLEQIFSNDKLNKADLLKADYFSNAVLINDGAMNFTIQALPWEAQLTSFRDAVIVDANSDQLPDILLVGNFFDNNIQMGKYDADMGTLLINKGKGQFEVQTLHQLAIKGQVRHARNIQIAGLPATLLVKNNDSLQVIRWNKR